MYLIVLAIHNFFRWIVVILAAIALARSWWGWLGSRDWTPADRKANLFFSIAMDIQLLLGLVLYLFLSPIVRSALSDLGAAMAIPEQRFFALEHIFYNIIAVALVHVGSAQARRGTDMPAKHRSAAIAFTLAAVFILFAMPWWRPLLRL